MSYNIEEFPGVITVGKAGDVIITFFKVFLVLGIERSIKSIMSGYLLDVEFNSASNELS